MATVTWHFYIIFADRVSFELYSCKFPLADFVIVTFENKGNSNQSNVKTQFQYWGKKNQWLTNHEKKYYFLLQQQLNVSWKRDRLLNLWSLFHIALPKSFYNLYMKKKKYITLADFVLMCRHKIKVTHIWRVNLHLWSHLKWPLCSAMDTIPPLL